MIVALKMMNFQSPVALVELALGILICILKNVEFCISNGEISNANDEFSLKMMGFWKACTGTGTAAARQSCRRRWRRPW